MKKIALSLTALCLAAPLLHADDVALMTLSPGKGKPLVTVAMEFFESDAPEHAANFKKLARKGFYKGTAIHRAFPHTLVQFGDPMTRSSDRAKVGTGGPGYTLPPEIHHKHTKGSIAAARLPDKINPARVSNGSQFYVCIDSQPSFDGQYTVFGQVIYGLDALDALSEKAVDTNDYPLDRLEVKSINIMPREVLPPAPDLTKTAAKVKTKHWWQIF